MIFLDACSQVRAQHHRGGRHQQRQDYLPQRALLVIPNDERIITIEDAAELQLQQSHVLRLEARPANIEGAGEVTIRDLVVTAFVCGPTA